jgi:hypothetical protein
MIAIIGRLGDYMIEYLLVAAGWYGFWGSCRSATFCQLRSQATTTSLLAPHNIVGEANQVACF